MFLKTGKTNNRWNSEGISVSVIASDNVRIRITQTFCMCDKHFIFAQQFVCLNFRVRVTVNNIRRIK